MKVLFLLIVLIFSLSACQRKEIRLVTTTSVENSGLLAYLLPHFEEQYGMKVKVVAVGTGAALRLGELGEADILIVHDRQRELDFIEAGYGERHHPLMVNDFIYVGPRALKTTSLEDFVHRLIADEAFFSRGDLSGTHARELALWETFGFNLDDFGSRYKETGQSMESTLMMASQKGYYTLTDRGTYLAMQDSLDLIIVFEDHPLLINDYGVIKVHRDRHNRDHTLADLLYDWLLSETAKELIRNYRINGQPLFYPYE